MEIYRVAKSDIMGMRINELFFDSLEKARNEYAKQLLSYRKEEKIVKRGDEQYLSSPIAKGSSIFEEVIKEHMIELWYKCSYEYDEWDTTVEHLRIEKVNIF